MDTRQTPSNYNFYYQLLHLVTVKLELGIVQTPFAKKFATK